MTPRAILMVATPFGFRPAPAVLEDLGAEVEAVSAALRTLEHTSAALVRQGKDVPLDQALARLPPHYRESCLTTCAMADVCRTQAPGVQGEVGDRAASLIGPGLDLARLAGLVDGASPTTPGEADARKSLADAASLFGWGWP